MVLFGGGIIPKDDVRTLESMGVDALFTPGTPTGEIVDYVKAAVEDRAGNAAS